MTAGDPGGDALDAVLAALGAALAFGEADHEGIAAHPPLPARGQAFRLAGVWPQARSSRPPCARYAFCELPTALRKYGRSASIGQPIISFPPHSPRKHWRTCRDYRQRMDKTCFIDASIERLLLRPEPRLRVTTDQKARSSNLLGRTRRRRHRHQTLKSGCQPLQGFPFLFPLRSTLRVALRARGSLRSSPHARGGCRSSRWSASSCAPATSTS